MNKKTLLALVAAAAALVSKRAKAQQAQRELWHEAGKDEAPKNT